MQLLPHELIIDNFAGGGGTSTGLEAAFGRPVDIAINHDPEAIAMHRINHPNTEHYCESVWDINPKDVTGEKPVGLVWLSPDCKHFSKAKGSVPVNKRIRGLAWIALKWAADCRPRMIMLENVEEFKTWGPIGDDGRPCKDRAGQTFKSFVTALRRQGYAVEHKELRACDYGVPTIRKRFFLIARRDGLPIVWPKPTHSDAQSLAVKKGKLKPWRTASECIDWSIPAPSIFERKRPLAENTCKRIAAGLMRYVVGNPTPFVINREGMQMPVLTECANTSSPRCMPANEPLRTICAQIKGGHHALIAPFIAKNYTGVIGSDIKDPLHTVTAKDHNSLVTAFLTAYYGNEKDGQSLQSPIRTVVSKERFGLVTVAGIDYRIVDIGFRMLQPRELFRAQGFDDSYVIDRGIDEHGEIIKLTKTAQTRMVGNSVCPPLAQALVEANFKHELSYKEKIA
ncbi:MULTISPECIES: DNA cytosine methyltransferase [unclassified Psychrobacter]|uniref:DNA cytosine methyltransferase n=1 Tax=unclassified Psychrobacter TaxID=196806 RepID=UPI0018F66CAA|nr:MULTISPECIES: DNA cytosine methyltransferase [unclassified Psychrobacter]